jgi:RNA ligase (TIGR02306 family)
MSISSKIKQSPSSHQIEEEQTINHPFRNADYFVHSTEADRHLAVIAQVATIEPIEKADSIELVTFVSLAWQCIVKRNEFKSGDFGIYFCIDSVLDPFDENYAFLQGKRLKTKKLLGRLSQGLLGPLSWLKSSSKEFKEGDDVSAVLKVRKYVSPHENDAYNNHGQNQTQSTHTFPSFVPKTNECRVQDVPRVIQNLPGTEVVITRKEDGTSTTFVHLNESKIHHVTAAIETTPNGETKETDLKQDVKVEENGIILVCGRNYILEENSANSAPYFAMEKKYDLSHKMRAYGRNIAIQAEIVGPKINGNKMKLKEIDLEVFNVYDIDERCYLRWEEVETICKDLGLKTVPVLFRGPFPQELASVKALLDMANRLEYAPKICAEGMVCKTNQGKEFPRHSFKVISNTFLLKHDH